MVIQEVMAIAPIQVGCGDGELVFTEFEMRRRLVDGVDYRVDQELEGDLGAISIPSHLGNDSCKITTGAIAANSLPARIDADLTSVTVEQELLPKVVDQVRQ
jgi:hypothetical protein